MDPFLQQSDDSRTQPTRFHSNLNPEPPVISVVTPRGSNSQLEASLAQSRTLAGATTDAATSASEAQKRANAAQQRADEADKARAARWSHWNRSSAVPVVARCQGVFAPV